MIKVGIFMADGCEEIEGLTVVDIVRRAKLEIETISITEKAEVTSSHQVTFKTDTTKAQADFDSYDAIVLPGGMPGTLNLGAAVIVQGVLLLLGVLVLGVFTHGCAVSFLKKCVRAGRPRRTEYQSAGC